MPWTPNDDKFRLLVGGSDCPVVTNYNAAAGVFQVPAQFDMTVGHTGLLTELIQAYAEFTPFELFVNDVRVMQGEIDDLASVGGDGTQLKVTGQDRLKRLIEGEIDSDETLSEVTFTDITELALKRVGLGDVSVVSSNLANRKAITGTYKVKEVVSKSSESTDTDLEETIKERTKKVHHSLVLETGTTYWDFLVQQYQRGGLFLWADSFGGFVLGQPNGKQDPLYRLVFRRDGSGGESGEVNVIGQPEWHRSSKPRYSEFHVMGHKGSGSNGRGEAFSKQIDQEVVAMLNPNPADRANGGTRKKIKTYRDDKVKAPEQSAFLAIRKMAESRRNALTLKYTIAGHTLPAITGGGRLVVQPDTVAHVVDDDRGIDGPMYIADCKYGRLPHSQTVLEMMRCEDLLYGEEDLLAKPRTVAKKGLVRMGHTEVFHPEWVKDPNWGGLPTLRGVSLGGNFGNTSQTPSQSGHFTVGNGAKRVR
jgi:prophage tail gpP-like protein